MDKAFTNLKQMISIKLNKVNTVKAIFRNNFQIFQIYLMIYNNKYNKYNKMNRLNKLIMKYNNIFFKIKIIKIFKIIIMILKQNKKKMIKVGNLQRKMT